MYDYLLDQLESFECFHILLSHLLLADETSFFNQSKYCSLLFLQKKEHVSCDFFDVHHLQMIKQKA